MKLWSGAPCRGSRPPSAPRFALTLVSIFATWALLGSAPSWAQRRPKAEPRDSKPAAKPEAKPEAAKGEKGAEKASGKPKVFDFTGLDLAGRLHTPQLLYFLERANEELERAFLERRSFIPHMVRSLDEEAL